MDTGAWWATVHGVAKESGVTAIETAASALLEPGQECLSQPRQLEI